MQEDLNKPMRYRMRFIRNQQSYIVPDRQYNTASLMSYYMGGSLERYSNTIEWAVEDPNVLQLELPGIVGEERGGLVGETVRVMMVHEGCFCSSCMLCVCC